MSIKQQKILYRTGDLYLPPKIVHFLDQYIVGSNRSLLYINLWSILHLFSGIFTAIYITDNIYYAFILHTIWELWQILIGMTKYRTMRGMLDICMDTIMFLAGFIIVQKYKYNAEAKADVDEEEANDENKNI